jgi:hypothetical protein
MRQLTSLQPLVLPPLAMIFALLAGLALASEPTPAPEAVDCSPAAVIAAQAELAAQLESFAEAYRQDDPEALAALYAVGRAYQELALACGHIPDDAASLVINTDDIDRALAVLATLSGDPLAGQALYNGEVAAASGSILGCSGCHENAQVAPLTAGTWTRFDEERRALPQFAGYTFAHYTVESILRPWDYFVPTYPEFTMPDFYDTQLSYQNLADLVAYLESQDQLPE